jgi:hypothetical protein
MKFINEMYFDAASEAEAKEGIIDPHPRHFVVPTILYRFGQTRESAVLGHWWLEESEYLKIRDWAILHGLQVPLAVRALTAILHDWGGSDGNMLFMSKVISKVPFTSWEGLTKNQEARYKTKGDWLTIPIYSKGRVREAINTQSSSMGDKITQLFIPGFKKDKDLNATAITILDLVPFSKGDSHIGGVPERPPNATMH